jgi:hypothetical protein
MTTTQLIIVVAVGVAIVAALLAARSGPRVTTIETVHEKDEGEDRP